ncbi:MAG: flagellar filament capping protein FliD [Bacillota bacterium]
MADRLRISGISTGYDTAQLIEQLMAVERRPVLLMQKQQSQINTRSDAWRDAASRLANLKSRAAALKSASVFNVKSVTSSADKTVSATADSSAATGTYRVWVDRLATSTQAIGAAQLGRGLDMAAKLAEAGFSVTPTAGMFTINGAQIRINADTVMSDGVDDAASNSILGKINSSGSGVTASVVANRMVLTANDGASPVIVGGGGDTSNFLTAARLLGAPSGATITSQGSLGVAKTTVALTGARLGVTIQSSILGGTAEGETAGRLATALEGTETVTFTYQGSTYTTEALTAGDDMAAVALDLEAKMNAAAGLEAGTIRVRVSGMEEGANDRFVITDTETPIDSTESTITIGADEGDSPTALKLAASDGATHKGMFKINGVAIEYDRTRDAVNDIINRINLSKANVSASYDLLSDKIVLTAKHTGEMSISVEDVGGNFLATAGLPGAEQQYGVNALFRVEGVNSGAQLSSASNTVKGIISNVTLTLKDVSEDPATITVAQNVDSACSAIKSFVDQYNSVMDLLATQTAYDKDKKTAGPLQGDGAVRTIQQTLRRLTTTAVDGLPPGLDSLLAIGISTGAAGQGDFRSAQLKIDDAKLKDLLAQDPEAVAKVFMDKDDGIAVKFESYLGELTRGVTGVLAKTQEILSSQTKSIDRRIADVERRLEKRREGLVRQFTQMEKVLASMQQQQAWMSAQFNSMQV